MDHSDTPPDTDDVDEPTASGAAIENIATDSGPTCGFPDETGSPCPRPAGWGRGEGVNEGLCRPHYEKSNLVETAPANSPVGVVRDAANQQSRKTAASVEDMSEPPAEAVDETDFVWTDDTSSLIEAGVETVTDAIGDRNWRGLFSEADERQALAYSVTIGGAAAFFAQPEIMLSVVLVAGGEAQAQGEKLSDVSAEPVYAIAGLVIGYLLVGLLFNPPAIARLVDIAGIFADSNTPGPGTALSIVS